MGRTVLMDTQLIVIGKRLQLAFPTIRRYPTYRLQWH